VLTGARQVGKTTLLRSNFTNYNYVTLDSIPDAELAENSPQEFLHRYKPPLIIDEVQYALQIFRHLKMAVDQDRQRNGQFLLTVSHKEDFSSRYLGSKAGWVTR
jgi:uncharacterized protein